MNLAIDIGNSRIKIGVFDKLKQVQVFVYDDASKINIGEIIKSNHIDASIISSTIDMPEFILNGVRHLSKNIILSHHTPLPFINKYQSKDTLGKDRIALVAAAQAQFPQLNNLVIGCGTCITFNFINANNEFIGGSIHPGLKMRLQAMHQFTGKLPDVSLENVSTMIGTNTKENMLAGVVVGAASEIDGMINEYLVKFSQLNVIITGGDAELLVSRLKKEIFAISNFTLVGLNHILEYNA